MLAMKVAFLDLLSRGSKLPILDIFQTSNASCNNCTTPVLSSSVVKGSMTKCVELCVDEVYFFDLILVILSHFRPTLLVS
jgi:hypothetical protein